MILLDIETTEQGAGLIHGDGVLFLEGLYQVISIFFSGIFDAEVVNDKGEGDVTRCMLPEVRGAGDRCISKLGKVDFQSVISDAAVSFQTRHAFVDLYIDPQVVLFDDLVREEIQGDFV